MAVESKQGGTTTNGANGAVPNGAAATVTATVTPGAVQHAAQSTAALPRRKRSSSLMQNAAALPTVEHSLEEFIAKANQTLVDVSGWGSADQELKAEEGKRREQDAQRWKQAENQMLESEVREQSLRRQLDGLQGQLAEAEARAAVAIASSSGSFKVGGPGGSPAHDATISDLKSQIEKAMQRMRVSDERSQELAQALASAKAEVHARPATPVAIGGLDEDEATERVRLAEAKATKAIAAARAAQAGLTVSSADLAAIESGLVVVDPPTRKSPWLAITLAFVGGLGIMFAVWKLVLKDDNAAAPVAATVQPAPTAAAPSAAPTEPTPAKPTVTPIDDQAATPTEQAAPAPTVTPTVTPIEEPAAAKPTAVKVAEPKAVEPKVAPVTEEPKTTKKASRPAAKPSTKKAAKASAGAIADPFADAPAPAKKKAPEKKPAGGIVDPF